MKRIAMIALIALAMIGLFAANQTLLLANSAPTAARSPVRVDEAMLSANQLYEAGQFVLAGQAYQQLVEQGVTDSALLYNLGNAYFRQGDPGRAILNYRRAQQLAPRDSDISANLDLARAQAQDQFEAANDRGMIIQVGNALQSWFTLNEVAMAALAAWILFALVVILFGSSRAGSAWRTGLRCALIATAIVLTVGVLALGSALYTHHQLSEGVIVAAEVDATSGPGSHQYATEFTLHSGAEVNLVETRGNWVRLVVPGSEQEGWVPAHAVEAVTG